MTTDFRALCARMADELDEYRQLLLDDRSVTHRLADEVRAALAEPETSLRDQVAALVQKAWNVQVNVEPPAKSEVAELVSVLHEAAAADEWDGASPEWCAELTRAADLLEHLLPDHFVEVPKMVEPIPVSERLPGAVQQALIKAECALSDIAEGEAEEGEGDPLEWAEKRAADALTRIRPVMRQHHILTSEWPPLPAHALPLPSEEGAQ